MEPTLQGDAPPGPDHPDRRQFLRRVGLGGAAVAAVAVPVGTLGAVMVAQAQEAAEELEGDDLFLSQLLASLDLAAATIYEEVPGRNLLDPAHTEAAATFASHHRDHAKRLNTAIGSDGEVTAPNEALLGEYASRVEGAAEAEALLTLLFELEQGLAATYQLAMEIFPTASVAGTGATIQPVECQHTVVWGQALDLPISQYVPGFQTTDGAFDPSA